MPYQSTKQSRYIHAKAGEGVGWAEKFVQDSHGTKVPTKPMYNPKLKRSKTRNYLQGPYAGARPGIGPHQNRKQKALGSGGRKKVAQLIKSY